MQLVGDWREHELVTSRHNILPPVIRFYYFLFQKHKQYVQRFANVICQREQWTKKKLGMPGMQAKYRSNHCQLFFFNVLLVSKPRCQPGLSQTTGEDRGKNVTQAANGDLQLNRPGFYKPKQNFIILSTCQYFRHRRCEPKERNLPNHPLLNLYKWTQLSAQCWRRSRQYPEEKGSSFNH